MLFLLIYLVLIKLIFVNTRHYATEYSPLIQALQRLGAHITNMTITPGVPITEATKPLVILPYDLEQSYEQIKSNFTTYAAERQIRPITPRLNVTPDCNCYTYQEIYWKPDHWTVISHNASNKNYDFEMVHLALTNQPRYFIAHIQGRTPPYNIYRQHATDALLFASHAISYFYEKYTQVRFKLFHDIRPWPTKPTGPCFVGLLEFPLVAKKMYAPTSLFDGTYEHDAVTTPCMMETQSWLQKVNSTEYRLFFPKGKLRNVLARTRQRSKYLEKTKFPEALDFEWGYPNDTGYILRIQVGSIRQNIPKNWWIHRQTDSLLGYHEHFFMPPYLRTIRTTYSYIRFKRHYYAEGKYAEIPGKKYLRQRVEEINTNTVSWPVPRKRRDCRIKHKTYCSPRCDEIEYYMQLAYQHIPPEYNGTFITPCINYLKFFTSIRAQRATYDSDTRHKKLVPKLPIYSYELISGPFLHGPLTSYQYETTFQQMLLSMEIDSFHHKWNQILPFFQQLKESIINYIIQHNNHVYYTAAVNLHSLTPSTRYTHELLRQSKTRLRDQIIQLIQSLGIRLDHTLFTLRQQTQRIYAFKLIKKNIQFLLHHPHLQANVIYRHTFGTDFFTSTPMASIWLPTPSQLTTMSSHNSQFKNNSPFLVPPQKHTSSKQEKLKTSANTQFDHPQQQQTAPSRQAALRQSTVSQIIPSQVAMGQLESQQNTKPKVRTQIPQHPITQAPWRFRIKKSEYQEVVLFQPNNQTTSKSQKIAYSESRKQYVIGKRLLESFFPELNLSCYSLTQQLNT